MDNMGGLLLAAAITFSIILAACCSSFYRDSNLSMALTAALKRLFRGTMRAVEPMPDFRVLPEPAPLKYLATHALVFIGGFPHSGTSLVRHMLLTKSSSGQDACRAYGTFHCSTTNVEGQWLLINNRSQRILHARLRQIYGPGQESNHLTETDFPEAAADMGVYLWNSWSRFWDLRKPVLVEKSPSNMLKLRWLAHVFRGARLVRFVIVVKHPVTNSVFESPRVCPDRRSCQEYAKANRHAFGEGSLSDRERTSFFRDGCSHDDKENIGQISNQGPSGCTRTREACARPRNLLGARLDYIRGWATSHEQLVVDLIGWGASGEQSVRVVRYEQLGTPCACEALLAFALSNVDGRITSGIHIRSIRKACAKAPTCPPAARISLGAHGASGDQRMLAQSRLQRPLGAAGNRGELLSLSPQAAPQSEPSGLSWLQDVPRALEDTASTSGQKDGAKQRKKWRMLRRRRLGFKGNAGEPVVVADDKAGRVRAKAWKIFLRASWKRFSNETRADLRGLHARTVSLGYSLLHPGPGRNEGAPGDPNWDVFAPWAIAVRAHT